ncbi:MAG: DNA-3-methyladenine glycosylase family protein [Candidatus Kariarchaeaceae archaeon]|jgi:DNA-3-methyladenine glycosylase II
MTDLPFYLTSDGENIITVKDIDIFAQRNKTLRLYLENYTIELRLLKIDTFLSFCSWIISQQISAIAAGKIRSRFLKNFTKLTPGSVLSSSSEKLRDLGLSKSKVEYIKNVAQFLLENNSTEVNHLTSDEIRKYYMQIRGVGVWTVNMHLIFVLGRKDILAAGDLAVRKGVQQLYGLSQLPNEKTTRKICQNWGKYATVGTLLAWEVVES